MTDPKPVCHYSGEPMSEVRAFGHGSIRLTWYVPSGRVGVETRGTNPVMDADEFVAFARQIAQKYGWDRPSAATVSDETHRPGDGE